MPSPKPITAAEHRELLQLINDPDPAIQDEGFRRVLEYLLAGRLRIDGLSADEQRTLRELIDKATGRSVH